MAQAAGRVPGRHVTTARMLIPLDLGWWLLDMPGLREIAPDASSTAVEDAVAEIDVEACRYRDCRHENEHGCAAQDLISPERLARF